MTSRSKMIDSKAMRHLRRMVTDEMTINRLTTEHDDLLTEIMRYAPPCWADADPIVGVALGYVRSLEGHGDNAMIGHAADCRCPGNYPNPREV